MSEKINIKTPVEGALFIRSLGGKVFPLKANGKEPAFNGWQAWAESATEEKIKKYATANPDANWGVYCGASNLLVVDLDKKEGRDGVASFKALVGSNPLPKTLVVTTPSQGKHVYFTGQGRTSAGTLGRGIDTRGEGGYVVAPGSKVNEKEYSLTIQDLGAPIAPLPEWLSKNLAASKKEAVVLPEDTLLEEGNRNNTLASLAGAMRDKGMGYDEILAAITVTNEMRFTHPLPQHEVEAVSRSISSYPVGSAKAAADFIKPKKFNPPPGNTLHFAEIQKRDWIVKNRYLGGFLSVVIAPGGVGKSTLTILDAISVSTGKNLSGFEIVKGGAVWLLNTEDPKDELDRRVAAACIHHKITTDELSNFYWDSGRNEPFRVVEMEGNKLVVREDVVQGAIEAIKERNVRLFIIDPFVRTHLVNENDNMAIDLVAQQFQRIADATGCAVCLVHHTSKGGSKREGEGADMNAARGASALVNAARFAHVLSGMTVDEAKRFTIDPSERSWYVRLDSAKANLSPPSEFADWYKRESVTLMCGDDVGTISPINLTDQSEARRSEEERAEFNDLLRALDRLMEPGDELSYSNIIGQLFNKKEFEHLFKYEG